MKTIKTKIKNYIHNELQQILEQSMVTVQQQFEILSQQKKTEPIDSCYETLAHKQGLEKTIATQRPIAPDGSPLPWYTYPAIEYFKAMDAKGLKIFEFGCGNSSLFWADKGAQIWCVEHNPQWYENIHTQSSKVQNIMLCEDAISYSKAIGEVNEKFDIIIIDGIWRNECAEESLQYLKPEGIIILDNSDWYTDVSDYFRSKNFFQVDFNGFGPCNRYCWTTSILLPFKSPFSARQLHPVPVGGIKSTKGEQW